MKSPMRNALACLFIAFSCSSLVAQAALASVAPSRNLADYPLGFYDGDPLPAKTVYLTFDDGPCEFTSEILDELERESVRATFFVCARWAVENWMPNPTAYDIHAAEIARMYAAGDAVGNHTADHRNLGWTGKAGIRREIEENRMLLEWSIGLGYPRMTLARPPFGSPWRSGSDSAAMKQAATALSEDSLVILWNEDGDTRDSEDYVKGEWYTKAKTDRSAPEFRAKAERILSRVSAVADGRGVVILMHDTHPTSVAALPRIIALLKSRGYSFATMEDWAKWRFGLPSADLLNAHKAKLGAAKPLGPS
jgi:peptidoglycan-N-acetylglucosamine deacetylase